MGCASSKQPKCRHCQAPRSPMSRRSFSVNVHHPPERKGDSYHVVALTSSTLGSIKLDSLPGSKWSDFDDEEDDQGMTNHEVSCIEKDKDFTMGMIEAKAWSKMIDEKIIRVAPRTPIRTPPGEPETINVNELMEGLEDTSPLRLRDHLRSFSFHVSADSIPPLLDSPRAGEEPRKENYGVSPNKTIWFDAHEKDSNDLGNNNLISKALVSEFDPEVISAFRMALEELSPTNPFHLKPRACVCDQEQQLDGTMACGVNEEKSNGISSNGVTEEVKMNGYAKEEKRHNGVVEDDGYAHINGFVDRMISEEEDSLIPAENGYAHTNGSTEEETYKDTEDDASVIEHEYEHYAKKRVVFYFTSLRGVRNTYEACCYVRLILKGLGVRVDERDVSMHSGFKEELKELLGDGIKPGLPKVFIGDEYIGGVEEIRRLHEDGKLEKVVEGCEMLDDDSGNLVDVCEACGDIRFIPCETCSGSCKIYYDCVEGDGEEYEEDEYGFQKCPDCNENGLVRCPICCY